MKCLDWLTPYEVMVEKSCTGKFLKYIGISLLSFILFVAVIIWWRSLDKIDIYYIPQVDFFTTNFDIVQNFTPDEERNAKWNLQKLNRPYFMSNYHWLKEGQKIALVYRTYSTGQFMVLDDEYFTQLTILIPTIQPGTYKIDGQLVRAFYTSGASAWPRSQCGASIENGQLIISENKNGLLRAKIDFDLDCKSTRNDFKKKISFHYEHEFKELQFSDANAWLGNKEEHIYQETYRR